jgi:hypothetical protein
VSSSAESLGKEVATLGGLLGAETDPSESFLLYFEKDFKCSGVCEKPLFFYSLPLSEGMPKDPCLKKLKGAFTSNIGAIGVVSLIAGIFTSISWIV